MGADGGLAKGLSHLGLCSRQAKLKHKLTVMYGQINGASRALEDVRAKQQDVRVSDRASPPALGPPCPPGRTGSSVTSTRLMGLFTVSALIVNLVNRVRSYVLRREPS